MFDKVELILYNGIVLEEIKLPQSHWKNISN